MTTEILSPVTTPSLLYPKFIDKVIRERRKVVAPSIEDYLCKRCSSNKSTHIFAVVEKELSKEFDFECQICGNVWKKEEVIPTSVKLSDVLTDQIDRLGNMTEDLATEFGALILREDNEIVLDFFQHGEDRSIELKITRPLKENEELLGTFHTHPKSNTFSVWDCATFLYHDFEKVSMNLGADKTINLAIKTLYTKMLSTDEIEQWEKDHLDKTVEDIAKERDFYYYRGQKDKLDLIVGDYTDKKEGSIEELLKDIEGVHNI